MTQGEALRRFIRDVTADRYRPVACLEAFPDARQHACAQAAAQGDLHAARELHEALIPGWSWSVGPMADAFTVYPPDHTGLDDGVSGVTARHPDRGRAWLVAILTARLVGMNGDEERLCETGSRLPEGR